jgi:hypothetical protein
MTRKKILSAALIAAAMLATPAVARESQASSRHLAVNANASSTPGANILAKAIVLADMAAMCGATGAPTTDRCFPQFHDIVLFAIRRGSERLLLA